MPLASIPFLAFLTELLVASVDMSVPILFAALGAVKAERSGVLNLGLEGMMLMGAFAGYWGAFNTGSLIVGLLMAILVGAIFGLIMAFLTVTLRANQVIAGVSLVLLGTGISSFLFRLMSQGQTMAQTVDKFHVVPIPLLSEIPIIGPALFRQNVMVYFALLLVPTLWFILYRTTIGLKIRSVGENPRAADSQGVSVIAVRYGCVIFSGIMAALGGSYLSLARMSTFQYSMTGGRGWMAVATVIFGRWDPIGAFGGSLFFGSMDALQLRLQAMQIPIPPQFFLMLPYLATIFVLLSVSRKRGRPASLATSYSRELR